MCSVSRPTAGAAYAPVTGRALRLETILLQPATRVLKIAVALLGNEDVGVSAARCPFTQQTDSLPLPEHSKSQARFLL